MLELQAQLIELRFRQGSFVACGTDRYRVIDHANTVTTKRACELVEGDIVGGRGRIHGVKVVRGMAEA